METASKIEEKFEQPLSNCSNKLKPEIVSQINIALKEDATLSDAAISRKTGIARNTVSKYRKQMPVLVKEVAAVNIVIKERAAKSHLDLLNEVEDVAGKLYKVLDELENEPSELREL